MHKNAFVRHSDKLIKSLTVRMFKVHIKINIIIRTKLRKF